MIPSKGATAMVAVRLEELHEIEVKRIKVSRPRYSAQWVAKSLTRSRYQCGVIPVVSMKHGTSFHGDVKHKLKGPCEPQMSRLCTHVRKVYSHPYFLVS